MPKTAFPLLIKGIYFHIATLNIKLWIQGAQAQYTMGPNLCNIKSEYPFINISQLKSMLKFGP